MINKTHRIFFSPTGTSEKITKQISVGLGYQTKDYELTFPKQRDEYKDSTFKNNDVILLGVPVYSGRIPEFLTNYFAGFKGNNTPAIITVIYGNREYDDALLELKNTFEKNGFKCIAAGAFIGEHSYTSKVATNRPDAEDLNMALQFGKDIKLNLNTSETLMSSKLIVKGNFPYKKYAKSPLMVPQTDTNCTNCAICAEICPMGAINFNNFKDIDAEKCIRCSSCIKNCPENAKSFTGEAFLNITHKLITNCSSRKEPELFLS